MITLNDVDRIVIDSSCQERWPCGHSSTVTLKDGREYSRLNSFEICSIVSNLANERINPGKNWSADKVKRHFSDYSESRPDMGWYAESPEIVLNRIFPGKSNVDHQPSTKILSFDLEGMIAKAKSFAKNDDRLFNYIQNILNDSQFQDNPKEYLNAWSERRGYTEEYRMPEDRARGFFDTNFSMKL